MAQDGPKMGPRWPKMAPGWPRSAPGRPLKNIEKPLVFIGFWASGSPKMGPRWAQDGPRWPRMAQDGPGRPQDGPKMAQGGRGKAQKGAKGRFQSSRGAEYTFLRGFLGFPKQLPESQDGPKMGPASLRNRQGTLWWFQDPPGAAPARDKRSIERCSSWKI